MLRFGSSPSDMRVMRKEDVFIAKLKLLIVMSNAYLRGYPLGKYRKEAIINNAKDVVVEAVDWSGLFSNFRFENESRGSMALDHVFYQRVKLLAVMAKAFAEGNPMGHYRKKALEDNLESLCEIIAFNYQLNEMTFLKVA